MPNTETLTEKSRANAVADLQKALENQSQNEATLEHQIASALEHLGCDYELQFNTGNGRCDIYLPSRRFVIEVKRPGSANPNGPGSKEGETQFEQCARYIVADHERESLTLGLDAVGEVDTPWVACLTDAKKWWVWEWHTKKDHSLMTPRLDSFTEKEFYPSEAEKLADWLSELTSQQAGKPWVPVSIAGGFASYQDRLKKLYDSDGSQGKETKFALWLEMLRGSGSNPSEDDRVKLFIQHTLLVTISRAVIASLTGDSREPIEVMSEGFASWPHRPSKSGAASINGKKWTNDIFEEVNQYDWRQRGRDVLRDLYQELVEEKHRKDYGEYYTPDWLAEGVVEDVLDEPWIKRSVEAVLKSPDAPGVGVLDPACGSGTFLFHAARRILRSKSIKNESLSDKRKVDVVTSLVMGIDIHPVAIEMARATLLRALPCQPSGGDSDLQIFQGDSLLYNEAVNISGDDTYEQVSMELDESGKNYVLRTPKNIELKFPDTLTTQKSFRENIIRLVEAARLNRPMPTPIGELDYDKDQLSAQYETLKQIIKDEGDSVWSWYILNATGPITLRKRGVDRIVANPPWVKMSHIQDADRKQEFEKLAQHLGVWGKRKRNTGLDIASMFVLRCSDLYLKKDCNAVTGWVLPWGSLRAENWHAAREKMSTKVREIWDLSKVSKQPFSGSKSCVWIRDESLKVSIKAPVISVLINKKNAKVEEGATWSEAREALKNTYPKVYPQKPSDYIQEPEQKFVMGAPLVPHCLVKIDESVATEKRSEKKVTTVKSTKEAWKEVGPQTGIIPQKWIAQVAKSSSLLPFYTSEPDKYIIPIKSGELDPSAVNNEYWSNAEEQYRKHRGKGGSTGETLFKHINFNNALLKQAHKRSPERLIVAYNSHGGILRAARYDHTCIFEYTLYWKACSSVPEAKFLTAILNADCLQDAYKGSQKADRDFVIHIWNAVPIPKFSKTDKTHTGIANLCSNAEVVANQCVERSVLGSSQQIARSNEIREALRDDGIAGRIDKAVAKLLPKYVS